MQNTPEVTPADVAQYIPDPALAAEAFVTLMQLQERGAIDLYLPAGWSVVPHRRFNVWDNARRERLTLEAWCARWLAEHPASTPAPSGPPSTFAHLSDSCERGEHLLCERSPRAMPPWMGVCACPCHETRQQQHGQQQDGDAE